MNSTISEFFEAYVDKDNGVLRPVDEPAADVELKSGIFDRMANEAEEEEWKINKLFEESKDIHNEFIGRISAQVIPWLDHKNIEYTDSDVIERVAYVYRTKDTIDIPLCTEDADRLAHMFRVGKHISENVAEPTKNEIEYMIYLGRFSDTETAITPALLMGGQDPELKQIEKGTSQIRSNDTRYITDYPRRRNLDKVNYGDVRLLSHARSAPYKDVFEQYKHEVPATEPGIIGKIVDLLGS